MNQLAETSMTPGCVLVKRVLSFRKAESEDQIEMIARNDWYNRAVSLVWQRLYGGVFRIC